MLDDRDYMRRRPEPENTVQTGLKCVYALIAINVVAFILTLGQREFAINELWLSPDHFIGGMFWQPLTAMFMHDGISHILFNMWGLYIFGGIVAPRLGGKAFLALYLVTGLLGNMVWLAAAWNSPAVLCGASGAVMAVTAASAVMAGDADAPALHPVPDQAQDHGDRLLRPGDCHGNHGQTARRGEPRPHRRVRRRLSLHQVLLPPRNALGSPRLLGGRRGIHQPRGSNGNSSASGWTYRRSPTASLTTARTSARGPTSDSTARASPSASLTTCSTRFPVPASTA